MNEFAAELKELIDKYREHPGVSDEDIADALMAAAEEVIPTLDDE